MRSDPLVRRDDHSAAAVRAAVEYGTRTYGGNFFLPVKPHRKE